MSNVLQIILWILLGAAIVWASELRPTRCPKCHAKLLEYSDKVGVCANGCRRL
jgi:hypothetical protein